MDLSSQPLGEDSQGKPVYLRDIWPSTDEIRQAVASVSRDMFLRDYADVFEGDAGWNAMTVAEGDTYHWQADSTYIQNPPFFADDMAPVHGDILGARILALLGDSVTTDHISPAGAIGRDTPAGRYLQAQGVSPADFNSYGSRRGNHEVMMRGTFANVRIRNEMLDNVEGGQTLLMPEAEQMSIYDAAMISQQRNVPLVVIAGKEYGTGSSRDWAAKGTRLLGVRAVIAESFERIHRSNLAGMGVLPLQFPAGVNRRSLGLLGTEELDLTGLQDLHAGMTVTLTVRRADGTQDTVLLLCRLDTADEVRYYLSGGIMPFVADRLLAS
jgi:aconitate hydratase